MASRVVPSCNRPSKRRFDMHMQHSKVPADLSDPLWTGCRSKTELDPVRASDKQMHLAASQPAGRCIQSACNASDQHAGRVGNSAVLFTMDSGAGPRPLSAGLSRSDFATRATPDSGLQPMHCRLHIPTVGKLAAAVHGLSIAPTAVRHTWSGADRKQLGPAKVVHRRPNLPVLASVAPSRAPWDRGCLAAKKSCELCLHGGDCSKKVYIFEEAFE